MEKKKLLLHCCCAPCALTAITRTLPDYAITLFYFNPTIYPQAEYEKRLGELKKVSEIFSLTLIEGKRGSGVFDKMAALRQEEEGGARCEICLGERLMTSARYAAENDFDLFATSLTLSPRKNAKTINAAGNAWAKEFGVKYLESDFKKRDGVLLSVRLCERYGIYRQNYCGCEFSIYEADGRQRKENDPLLKG